MIGRASAEKFQKKTKEVCCSLLLRFFARTRLAQPSISVFAPSARLVLATTAGPLVSRRYVRRPLPKFHMWSTKYVAEVLGIAVVAVIGGAIYNVAESERIKRVPRTIAEEVVRGECARREVAGVDPQLWENDTAVMAKTFDNPQFWLILVGVKAIGKSTQLCALGERLLC